MIDQYVMPEGFRIVSGGQSGADIAGLDWAIANNVPHSGWCPKGRKSEDGPIDSRYNLVETPDSKYLQRTEWNVRDSDGTLIFTMTDKLDGGSKRTAEFAEKLKKPSLHFRPGVHPKFIARWLDRNQIKVLNIAGKRESSAPGVYEFVLKSLTAALLSEKTT